MKLDDIAVFIGGMFLVACVIAFAFFVGGVVVYAGWNYGVAAVADVPALPYIPACFIALLINVVRTNVNVGRS